MKISFHGAAREVTGSCHLVEVDDAFGMPHHFLIDCGMFQGERFADDRNALPFGFDPKIVETVFVTHAHADHTGRLPHLMRSGFTGSVYLTEPTYALSKLVLEDAFHIMEENRQRSREPLLYTEGEMEAVFERCQTVGYHEAIEIAPGITVMFHDAGHILGSSFISVEAEGKRIVFSGDVGNDDVPILADTEAISTADAVVCESTYGQRVHEGRLERSDCLKVSLREIIERQGILLIPSFSIERTQELLYELNQILLHDLKTDIPIFLDSPMAIKATQVYRHFQNHLTFDVPILSDPDRDFFSFPNLRETLTVEESKTINNVKSPKVIVAGSGMMNGGRVQHHLRHCLSDGRNTILIIGYQASGTLGRQIYDGAESVRIFGEAVPVRAQVKAIGAFSAHGDMPKLTHWLRPEDGKIPKKIILVHGDADVQDAFAEHLRKEFATEVFVPSLGETIEI